MTGIAAAVTISLVLMFFTEPLQYVPNAALGAVLIFAAFSLFDLRSIRELWNVDRLDMSLAVATMLAVVAVGAIHGILVAVGLALCRFVHKTARPRDEVLGEVDGSKVSLADTETRDPRARFSLGVPELSLILGSRPYGGVSGGWGAVQPAHERQQHLCRGMGVPYNSPNNTRLGAAHSHIPLCVRATDLLLRYI